ncbi:uncharacterized protein Adf1_11 isoform X2 [Zeugodacus cucurbitae]|uniref:uncharacterized protein Adf1_11 isoform X2 n=1 Tax=Zeugodacus cucurbitae TaxID=28588 RepID=UPI0023D938BD|nr:uncharacterized protein Adf1_11 isoform X2 [Zeugodacus cucurbitae]
MDIDPDTLINEIVLHPILWDQKHKAYHNRYLVEKEWECLEAAMKQPNLLKKKWKYIRDQFRSEYKKILVAKSGDPDISEAQYELYTTWAHFKSLLFLKDQIKPRKISGNLSKSTTCETPIVDFDNSTQDSAENTQFINVKNEFTDYELTSNTPVATQVNKRHHSSADEMLTLEERKLELLEKKIRISNERDDDELFFQSILPFMKLLDLEQKLRCRIDIQNTIYNYAFSDTKNRSVNIDGNSTVLNNKLETN